MIIGEVERNETFPLLWMLIYCLKVFGEKQLNTNTVYAVSKTLNRNRLLQ